MIGPDRAFLRTVNGDALAQRLEVTGADTSRGMDCEIKSRIAESFAMGDN